MNIRILSLALVAAGSFHGSTRPDTFWFDFHGVLGTFGIRDVLRIVPQSLRPRTLRCIGGIIAHEIRGKKTAPDGVWCSLYTGIPCTSFLETMNLHRPVRELFELLKRLKQNGHRVYIVSNIGQYSYDYVRTVILPRHGIRLLHAGETTDRPLHTTITIDGAITATLEDGWQKKPFLFTKALQTTGTQEKMYIIDDGKKKLDVGVKACHQAGARNCKGIHFVSLKQLSSRLQQLNILAA